MRINLMDASLRALGGHPHDIDLRLTRAMVAAGHDVHVYCHIKANETLQSHYHSIAPITPLFSIHPYTSPNSFEPLAGDIIKNLEGGIITANELNQTRDAEVWLWPSFYSHQLNACSLIKTRALISACIHHPPDFFSPGDIAWWRHGFMKSHKNGLNLRAGFIEPETLYPYMPLSMNGDLSVFPFPNDGPETIKQPTALKTMGVFGFQREEKGGAFMHPLLKRLVADGYNVIMHDSNPDNGMFADIDGLTRIGHVMNLDDEIAKCDLVLAPYQPEAYRYRGSGIVMSAIANGIPVVAPFGSAPGRLIAQNGAGTLFNQYTLASVYAAIQQAVNHYPTISQSAYKAASQWKEHHGVMKFVQAVT